MTDKVEAAPPPHPSIWRRIVPYTSQAFVLLAVVVPFLRFNEYSLLLPESLILIAAAVVIGASLGATGQLRPRTLAPMLMALTLGYFLFYRQEVTDSLVELARSIGDVVGSPPIVLGCLAVALFLAVSVICVLMKRHIDMIVFAVFGTMVLSTVVLPTDTGGEPISTGALPAKLNPLPPVIHIILDEHIGLAGLPEDVEESAAARRAITETYKDFALYSHAFSRFAETKFSFTSLMNRDLGTNVDDLIESETFKFTLKQNDWFDALKSKGYAIKVYQSAWYDMCTSSAVDACYTYSFFSPNAIQRTDLPSTHVCERLPKSSSWAGAHYKWSRWSAPRRSCASAPTSTRDSRGVAYVVHLLTTHFGYLYAPDCSLRDPSSWEREGYGDDERYTAAERRSEYRRYLDQVVCAEKQMDALFAQLKALGIYDEATIIIHGDHGSRIGERPYIIAQPQLLTDQDLRDHYSTLLAIKAPGVAPGLIEDPIALQSFFAKTFLGGAREPSPPANTVFMRIDEDNNFKPVDFDWSPRTAPVAGGPASGQVGAAEASVLTELRR